MPCSVKLLNWEVPEYLLEWRKCFYHIAILLLLGANFPGVLQAQGDVYTLTVIISDADGLPSTKNLPLTLTNAKNKKLTLFSEGKGRIEKKLPLLFHSETFTLEWPGGSRSLELKDLNDEVRIDIQSTTLVPYRGKVTWIVKTDTGEDIFGGVLASATIAIFDYSSSSFDKYQTLETDAQGRFLFQIPEQRIETSFVAISHNCCKEVEIELGSIKSIEAPLALLEKYKTPVLQAYPNPVYLRKNSRDVTIKATQKYKTEADTLVEWVIKNVPLWLKIVPNEGSASPKGMDIEFIYTEISDSENRTVSDEKSDQVIFKRKGDAANKTFHIVDVYSGGEPEKFPITGTITSMGGIPFEELKLNLFIGALRVPETIVMKRTGSFQAYIPLEYKDQAVRLELQGSQFFTLEDNSKFIVLEKQRLEPYHIRVLPLEVANNAE